MLCRRQTDDGSQRARHAAGGTLGNSERSSAVSAGSGCRSGVVPLWRTCPAKSAKSSVPQVSSQRDQVVVREHSELRSTEAAGEEHRRLTVAHAVCFPQVAKSEGGRSGSSLSPTSKSARLNLDAANRALRVIVRSFQASPPVARLAARARSCRLRTFRQPQP